MNEDRMDTPAPISITSNFDSKKEGWETIKTMNGGHMIALSPPAGDPAGSQTEPSQGSSSGSDLTGDAEGVWSVDIDQAFQEALAIYPPCGRRKIIISDEGKMYGRNELIARYIKLRCGKTRTRKQVSSHIQVLARKKARDDQAKKKTDLCGTSLPLCLNVPSRPATNTRLDFPQLSSMPSNPALNDGKDNIAQQLLGKSGLLNSSIYPLWQQPFPTAFGTDIKPFSDFSPFTIGNQIKAQIEEEDCKGIQSHKLSLNGFSAYLDTKGGKRVDIVSIPAHVGELARISLDDVADKYPPLLKELFDAGPSEAFFLAKCWANVHFDMSHPKECGFAVDSYYKSREKFDIKVSTKVCSFGKNVVEKVETFSPVEEDGQFTFLVEKSAMCEYMVKFISELKKLESIEYMNNVLENFTILQVVTNMATSDVLMVIGFVFEVNSEPESTYSLFRLSSSSDMNSH